MLTTQVGGPIYSLQLSGGIYRQGGRNLAAKGLGGDPGGRAAPNAGRPCRPTGPPGRPSSRC
jgi:hypothetical protein